MLWLNFIPAVSKVFMRSLKSQSSKSHLLLRFWAIFCSPSSMADRYEFISRTIAKNRIVIFLNQLSELCDSADYIKFALLVRLFFLNIKTSLKGVSKKTSQLHHLENYLLYRICLISLSLSTIFVNIILWEKIASC